MHTYYKLEGKKVVPCKMEECFTPDEDRRVAMTHIGKVDISTVFLGINHAFDDRVPMLFETMIFQFGGKHDEYCERYSTWQDAEEGHKRAVKMVREAKESRLQKFLQYIVKRI